VSQIAEEAELEERNVAWLGFILLYVAAVVLALLWWSAIFGSEILPTCVTGTKPAAEDRAAYRTPK
jgi:cytoskeletal protein RodZ